MRRKLLSILALLLFVSGANAQSTITVYATNTAGWSKTCIYYWGDGEATWPGTAMENFYTNESGLKFYRATIPAGVSGIKFTNGSQYSSKATDDITEHITDGAWWEVSGTSSYDATYKGLYPVTLNEGTNNSSVLSSENGKTHGVTLTRTLQAGGWNTFCAPFDISSSQITNVFGASTKVRELGSSDFNSTTKELTLNFTNAESIAAGKPYLLYLGSGSNVVNPTFDGVTISNSTTTTTTDYADFVPVMNPTNLTGGDKTVLFITGGNTLTYPTDDGNINGFRAYFHLKEGAAAEARAFTMSFGDEETGITTVLTDEPATASGTYTLDGRRIEAQPTRKGVYIVNGKKTIIK